MRKLVRVSCEGFGREVLVRKPQAAECIGDNVIDAFDVREFGTKIFDDESPSHDALGVECLVDQILVVSEDFDFVTQQNVSVFLKGLDNTEEFSLRSRVSSLSWVQLLTVERDGLSLLGDHRS